MDSFSDDELEYLAPSFDPSTLTMAKLRGILMTHNIAYSSAAKKSDLVDLFSAQLAPRARKILAARARIRRTSKGITDMPSSQESSLGGEDDDDNESNMAPPSLPTPRARRSKSRTTPSTRASTVETDTSTRRSRTPTASKHPRASDGESTTDREGNGTSRKSRRSELMPVRAPTVKIEEPPEILARPRLGESAFSHENPFQSGSSPLAPGEARRRSHGVEGRKSSSRRRKIDSLDKENVKQEEDVVVPSLKDFHAPVARTSSRVHNYADSELVASVEAGEEFTAEEQQQLALQPNTMPQRRQKLARSSGILATAPWVVLLTLLLGSAAWWRKEKIEIGYCGIGKIPVAFVDAPEWLSVLQPQCEPCPAHAFCSANFETQCAPDFLLTPHPLALAGLIPLPPTCEPDGDKVRKVKTVADRAIDELRQRRAKWECGDAVEWDGTPMLAVGVEEPILKAEVAAKRRRGMTDAEFEELWKGAIGEIVAREEVTAMRDV